MAITKTQEGSKLNVALEGRLDTTTAPNLEAEMRDALNGVTELDIDMASLAYISSAGLRVMLALQKQMNKQKGSMIIRNASEELMEIFDVTGFVDVLHIV